MLGQGLSYSLRYTDLARKSPPCINHFNLRCAAVTAVLHKYSHTKVMDWVLLVRLSSATSCLQSEMIVL